MKTLLKTDVRTRSLLNDSWRLTPARMAEYLTNGRFQRYRHVQYLERKIAQEIGRGGARLVISLPPRHGKSWLASLFTPAWFLSLWPDQQIILSSHDANLAMSWGRSVREFLERHESQLDVRLSPTSSTSSSWGTTQGGGMVTAGVGGPISGSGGGLLIVDDPIKTWAEASSEKTRQKQIDWFNSTLCTRAERGASIIVVMTRWHERDLAGYLETEHPNDWQFLRIPAIAEEEDPLHRPVGEALCKERYDLDALAQIKRGVGSRIWTSLYQQKPQSDNGSVLKREWWRFYQTRPEKFEEVIQTWDMAFKDTKTCDYVVGQVWGRIGANKFLLDQVRGRMDFAATVSAVQRLSEKYPQAARKYIEDKANGSAVVSILRESVSGLITVEAVEGKYTRVNAVSAEIESGNVYLPTPTQAPWIEDFISECAGFPNAKHDDQVDAMAYALHFLRKGSSMPILMSCDY